MDKMTIGNQLKKAREQKRLSLDDAYQYTRILPDMLSAMEEDNFAKISNPTYIRSFLRKYSSYLGLNAEDILNQYSSVNMQKGLSEPEPVIDKKKAPVRRIDMNKIANISKLVFKFILIVFLLIIFIKTTGWAKFKFLSWRKARSEQRLQVSQIELANKAKPVKKKEIKVVVKKPKIDAKDTQKGILIPEDEKLTLLITTTEDVWVELKKDAKIILKNVLKKGSQESWQADDNFELWTGNAAAMNITLNGHNLGSPGTGVKKGIIINRRGIQD